jgi:tight adherence protein C
MNTPEIVFFALTFVVASGAVYGVIRLLSDTGNDRLGVLDQPPGASAPTHAVSERVKHMLEPLAKLSAPPQQKWEESLLRTRFLNAGFHGFSAPLIYFAAKSVGAFLVPGLFALFVGLSDSRLQGSSLLAFMLLLAAVGYYLPNVVLARLIAHRRRELFESFPDALDLMRVCVEAGLGLDAAIARVGDEMRLNSPALYEELHMVSLELRAGAARDAALHHLALRMGIDEADSLVATLVQAERFGTSVAQSLRVHAETLRDKRRQRAEEAAAKVPVKLLFPLVFCIFPALLVVLLGPAMIGIAKVLFPAMMGGH